MLRNIVTVKIKWWKNESSLEVVNVTLNCGVTQVLVTKTNTNISTKQDKPIVLKETKNDANSTFNTLDQFA